MERNNNKKKVTPYDVLGVSSSASLSEIKARYRVLVLKFHPDVDGSAEARVLFGDIQNSYEILENAASRSAYDREMNASQRRDREESANAGAAKATKPSRNLNEEWWMHADGFKDYAKKQMDHLNLQKRKQMEAHASTFRWPTGESYEKMDEHQRYFYHQMLRGRRHFSTKASRPSALLLVAAAKAART